MRNSPLCSSSISHRLLSARAQLDAAARPATSFLERVASQLRCRGSPCGEDEPCCPSSATCCIPCLGRTPPGHTGARHRCLWPALLRGQINKRWQPSSGGQHLPAEQGGGRLGACYLTAMDSLGVAKSGSLRGGQDGCCWLSSFSSLLKSFLDAFFLRSLRKQLSKPWSRAVCSKERGRRGFEEGVAQTGMWDGTGFAKPL